MSGVSRVKSSLAPASSLPTLERWRLSIYDQLQEGAPIAHVRPLTIQGRHSLWDHVTIRMSD